jgi:hypothetical protein
MANPLTESAVQAIEVDAFATEVPDLIQFSKTLYNYFKKNATIIPVSNVTAAGGVTRPSFRIPVRIQAGAGLTQGTGNGDSLGRGTGSTWAGFALSPIFVYNVNEITYLARIATEGRKRGLFNVQAQELRNTLRQAEQGIEALVQGDGSGALDLIPSTATINNGTGSGVQFSSIVGLNNAFQFTDQQTIQVISTGAVNRGSFTISYVDSVSQTIYSSMALPAGTTNSDYLVIAGASGAAGSSILGIRAWQVNSNLGTIGGLNRANFPGRLSTPTINLGGASISLNAGIHAMALMVRALGEDNPAITSATWYCGPDQAYQITNLYLNMLYVNAADAPTGKEPMDVVKGHWPKTFGSVDLLVGANALPGRLDLIAGKTWYLGEMLPLELYDFGGGLTVMPVPDIVNGGYLTSSEFVYNCAFNIGNSNPRAGVYIQGAAVTI